MKMRLGTTELLIILAVVILVFGPSQIPKLSRLLGKSIKGLQKGLEGSEEQTEKDAYE